MDTSEDPDAEEALKGFDFLSSPDEMDTSPESRGNGDGTDWGESESRAEIPQIQLHYFQYENVYFLLHSDDRMSFLSTSLSFKF